jgi:hypothetical protein
VELTMNARVRSVSPANIVRASHRRLPSAA